MFYLISEILNEIEEMITNNKNYIIHTEEFSTLEHLIYLYEITTSKSKKDDLLMEINKHFNMMKLTFGN